MTGATKTYTHAQKDVSTYGSTAEYCLTATTDPAIASIYCHNHTCKERHIDSSASVQFNFTFSYICSSVFYLYVYHPPKSVTFRALALASRSIPPSSINRRKNPLVPDILVSRNILMLYHREFKAKNNSKLPCGMKSYYSLCIYISTYVGQVHLI